mgnify:CR=1 FL=1
MDFAYSTNPFFSNRAIASIVVVPLMAERKSPHAVSPFGICHHVGLILITGFSVPRVHR